MRTLLSHVLIVSALISVCGCDRTERNQLDTRYRGSNVVASALRGDSSGATRWRTLGIDDVPEATLVVARTHWPGFVAFSPAKYATADTSGASVSSDEGLVVVRGNFEGKGNEDFIIAGSDGSRGLLIALFVRSSGEVDAHLVAYLANHGPAGAGTPSVTLARTMCEFSCTNRAQFAVRVTTLDVQGHSVGNLYWDATRREFRPDEPGGD